MKNIVVISYSLILSFFASSLFAMDPPPSGFPVSNEKWVDANNNSHSEEYPFYAARIKGEFAFKNDAFLTLYRAVDPTAGMHIKPEPRVLWLDAILLSYARPYNVNGEKTVEEHNAGKKGNYSQYTSWTPNLCSVRLFASEKACLLFLGNFSTKHLELSPDAFKEKEVLVHGTAKHFKIFMMLENASDFSHVANTAEVEDLVELDEKLLRQLRLALKNSPELRQAFISNDFREIDLLKIMQSYEGSNEKWGTHEDLLALHQDLYNLVFQDLRKVQPLPKQL